MPQLEALSNRVKLSKRLDNIRNKKPEDFMRRSSINKMRKVLKSQGLSNEDIEKRIDEFCNRNKNIEIQDLEKKFNA